MKRKKVVSPVKNFVLLSQSLMKFTLIGWILSSWTSFRNTEFSITSVFLHLLSVISLVLLVRPVLLSMMPPALSVPYHLLQLFEVALFVRLHLFVFPACIAVTQSKDVASLGSFVLLKFLTCSNSVIFFTIKPQGGLGAECHHSLVALHIGRNWVTV